MSDLNDHEKEIVQTIKEFLMKIGTENNILKGNLLKKEVKDFLIIILMPFFLVLFLINL